MPADVIIVAAGRSSRFGGGDKLFADLCGKPVIAWSLEACEAANEVASIIAVCAAETTERIADLGRSLAPSKFQVALPGGERRRDSVAVGMQAARTAYVAVHDGARPLADAALFDRCILAAQGRPGAIAAAPVADTIKETRGGRIVGHPDRSTLWAAQTPQVVLRKAWLDAAEASDNDETDDAAMLDRFGLECVLVESDAANLKITRPVDLELARLLLQERSRS